MPKRQRTLTGYIRRHARVARRSKWVALASALAGRYANGGSWTKTETENPKASTGLTSHYDRQVQYRKRRTRFSRKKRRFQRSVRRVDLAGLAPRTNLINSNQAIGNAASKGSWGVFWLNGRNGDTAKYWEIGGSDLASCASNVGTAGSKDKIFFGRSVLDITVTNKSDGNANQELDIYELAFYEDTTATNFDDIIQTQYNNVTKLASATNKITMADRGASLFDFGQALATCKAKILKKTKYFLGVGVSVTYQMKGKPFYATVDQCYDNKAINAGSPILAGKTRALVCMWKPVAGYETLVSNLYFGATRKYTWKEKESNTPYQGSS